MIFKCNTIYIPMCTVQCPIVHFDVEYFPPWYWPSKIKFYARIQNLPKKEIFHFELKFSRYIWYVPEVQECTVFYSDNRFLSYVIEKNCKTCRFLQIFQHTNNVSLDNYYFVVEYFSIKTLLNCVVKNWTKTEVVQKFYWHQGQKFGTCDWFFQKKKTA